MRYTVTTPPAVEPVEAADVWNWLHIDPETDDGTLERLIPAARMAAENYTRRAFIAQTITLKADSWPCEIVLPRAPLIDVTSIGYVDEAGVAQVLAADQYQVDAVSEPGVIVPAYDVTWPSLRAVRNAVTVTYRAGYGTVKGDVPQEIGQAILMLTAHRFAAREGAGGMPPHIAEMLNAYRVYQTLGG